MRRHENVTHLLNVNVRIHVALWRHDTWHLDSNSPKVILTSPQKFHFSQYFNVLLEFPQNFPKKFHLPCAS